MYFSLHALEKQRKQHPLISPAKTRTQKKRNKSICNDRIERARSKEINMTNRQSTETYSWMLREQDAG